MGSITRDIEIEERTSSPHTPLQQVQKDFKMKLAIVIIALIGATLAYPQDGPQPSAERSASPQDKPQKASEREDVDLTEKLEEVRKSLQGQISYISSRVRTLECDSGVASAYGCPNSFQRYPGRK